jgi:ABC-type transport system substrate-binding protein
MVNKDHGDPRQKFLDELERRKFMAALGIGAAGLAGCGGGGDGGDGGDTTTSTTTTTTTTTEDGDGGDGGDGGGGTDETKRYDSEDATFRVDRRPPTPAEAQYQQFGPNGPTFDGMLDYVLLSRSYADQKFYGEVAEDWNYRPGVMDITLKEDFYFWDGEQITADDVMVTYKLSNYMWGGDENDAYENIVRAEKTGDFSVRFFLADTFREQFALANAFTGWTFFGSLNYYGPWIEKFEGASTQEEVEKVRTNLGNKEEKNPEPFYYNAFKIVGAEEDRWNLKLRTQDMEQTKAPAVPHFVEDINYANTVITTIESKKRVKNAFLQGKVPYGNPTEGTGQIDESKLDFETEWTSLIRPADVGAYSFNCSKPPMSNAHFRRAWMYMLDTKKHSTARMNPEKAVTGFFTENRENIYISDSVRESLTDYKWDQHAVEAAEREMKKGGFEKSAKGNWLFQKGDRAGTPMSFEIPSFSWMSSLRNHSTSFTQAMDDFGIKVKHVGDTGGVWGKIADTSYDVAMTYWGGGYPARTFAINFGTVEGFGSGNPLMPDTWEGPPVGQPDADPSETYQLTTAAQRLKVTRNDEQYQRLVDRLSWAFNQTVPRAPIGAAAQRALLNTTKWDWPIPIAEGDNPHYWIKMFFRRPWNTGGVAYVPEGER